jgi:hypothetical protein
MANVVTMFVISSRTLAQSRFMPAVSRHHLCLCVQHIRKDYRISNALFSLGIIILSRKPITSHS